MTASAVRAQRETYRRNNLRSRLEREAAAYRSDQRRAGRDGSSLTSLAAIERSIAFGRDAFEAVLAAPCPKHDAGWGEPCTTDPSGVCGARVADALPRRHRRPARAARAW